MISKPKTLDGRSRNIRSLFLSLDQLINCPMVHLLPAEITTDILSRLPVDSVIQCKIVCKTWRSVIDDPVFIDLHTCRIISDQEAAPENHTFGFFIWIRLDRPLTINAYEQLHYGGCFGEYNDDDDQNISSFKISRPFTCCFPYFKHRINWTAMNSCNGLIFMVTLITNQMAICNPLTREFVDIPPRFTTTEFMETGFGYNPSTNEYKIVVVLFKDVDCPPGKVSVYTLGSGEWRDKGDILHALGGSTSVHLNGVVYWLKQNAEIVSFDLEHEEFRIVPSPPLQADMYYEQLGSLGGCLYVIRKPFYVEDVEDFDDILVRNKEDYTWSKKFSIAYDELCCDCKPLAILKSGKILWYSAQRKPFVVYYDPEIGSENASFPQLRCVHIIHYVKSLVSLKALGEMNARIYDIGEYVT